MRICKNLILILCSLFSIGTNAWELPDYATGAANGGSTLDLREFLQRQNNFSISPELQIAVTTLHKISSTPVIRYSRAPKFLRTLVCAHMNVAIDRMASIAEAALVKLSSTDIQNLRHEQRGLCGFYSHKLQISLIRSLPVGLKRFAENYSDGSIQIDYERLTQFVVNIHKGDDLQMSEFLLQTLLLHELLSLPILGIERTGDYSRSMKLIEHGHPQTTSFGPTIARHFEAELPE